MLFFPDGASSLLESTVSHLVHQRGGVVTEACDMPSPLRSYPTPLGKPSTLKAIVSHTRFLFTGLNLTISYPFDECNNDLLQLLPEGNSFLKNRILEIAFTVSHFRKKILAGIKDGRELARRLMIFVAVHLFSYSSEYDQESADIEVLMNEEGEGSQIAVKLDGRYTNYFKVGHNAFEFLLDFGQLYPENMKAHLHTRIITSPKCAKFLLESLRESIERYERTFEGSRANGQEAAT